MNDQDRELLRQYFLYKDQFLVAKYTPIEQRLRAAIAGPDQGGLSQRQECASSAAGGSVA